MLSTIYAFFNFILRREFKLKSSKIFFTFLSLDINSSIILERCYLIRSKLFISGINNKVNISGKIKKSTINIKGNNNIVIIESNCILTGVNLYIIGNDCLINIGEHTEFHGGFIFVGGTSSKIIIGENCLFAHDVDIMNSDSHQILFAGKEINSPKDIVIGNYVWIGAHTSILKGVEIGENAIIGTRSVVTKSIRNNTINVGAPTREVRKNIYWSKDRNS